MESPSAQEELYHIQESTNEDGTVDVKIKEWEKRQNSAVVYFEMPDVTEKKERIIWPQKDTTDNKFVRLVNNCGYDIAAADQIIGETIKYDVNNDELVVPKQKTLYEQVLSLTDGYSLHVFNPVFTLFYPLVSLIFLYMALFKDDFDLSDNADARGVMIGAVLWPMLLIVSLSFRYII